MDTIKIEMTEVDESGKEDLMRQCAEEFLIKHPRFAGFTVGEVLGHSECRKQIDALADRKVAELQVQAKKAEAKKRRKLNELAATLVAERPLTAEEIAAKLSPEAAAEVAFQQKLAAAGNPVQDVPEIPNAVLELKQSHGAALLSLAYETADNAVLFRGWLIGCIKRHHGVLRNQGLDPEYRGVVEENSDRLQRLINAVSEVVRAWGLDPKEEWVDNPKLFARIRRSASTDERFAGFSRVITPEDIKALEAMEMAEQEREANRSRTRDQIAATLVAFMDEGVAAKRAHSLVKKYYNEKSDTAAILRRAAVNKMIAAQSDEDATLAKLYACACGMDEEQLAKAIDKLRTDADRARRVKEALSWGSMSASAEAARAAKKNGGNKKDGKKRGGKGRR